MFAKLQNYNLWDVIDQKAKMTKSKNSTIKEHEKNKHAKSMI